jgi:hypothetical protein
MLGILCQRKALGIERWFKFDGNLNNSGSLATTANVLSGSINYSSTGADTGLSANPISSVNVALVPTYALGTNFYIEFYATLTNDGNYNTIIGSSGTGLQIGKTSFGGGKIQVNIYGNPGGGFDSSSPWADDTKHKFKITFISGVITLYVDDILRDTGATNVTDFTMIHSQINLFYGVGVAGGYYDDLIIHRVT